VRVLLWQLLLLFHNLPACVYGYDYAPATDSDSLTRYRHPAKPGLINSTQSSKRPFKATVIDADDDDSHAFSEISAAPEKQKKKKKKRARKGAAPGIQNS
jgi:hypothetical protein